MPNPNVAFGGRGIIRPGAYSAIDASQLVPSSLGLANVIAIMGDCTGGQPNTPLFFRSGESAKAVLRSGALLDAIRMAYDPNNAPDAGGADLIIAIRVNPATQSTLDLAGSTGTSVTLTSRDYGIWTTGISAKVEAGSVSGKKVTIKYVDTIQGTILEVYDNLASTRAAVIAAINSGVSNGQGASQFVTAAAGADTTVPVTAAYAALASGVEGTTTSTHYTNALTKLESEDVDIVVPISIDTAITALVQAHVEAMSGVKARRERIAIVGGAVASGFGTQTLYVADLVSKATTLSSNRVVLVGPGIKRPNASGVTTAYGSEYLAAIFAGIAASQEVGQTPTYKLAKVVGSDVQFTADEIETLLLAGVCPLEFVKSVGFRFVQAITTYQTDANPMFREFSVRRVGDFLMKSIRERLERDFVGSRGDASTIESMLNATVSVLQLLISDKVITAFQNVNIKVVSGVARVQFEFSPVEPINYILITGYAKPGSLAVSFSGQASFNGTSV